jgi:UDP-glucose 4-epimerase
VPLDENHPQVPISPYGRSKLMTEMLLQDAHKAHGLPYAILRYFNAGGAAGEIGEDHTPETHLIPLAIEAALRQIPLTLFGIDYETPDGSAIRDYIHVNDLAAAHVRALEVKEPFEVNLGTGKGYSVKEVIAVVEHVTGLKVPLKIGPRRPGDPPQLVADNRRAQELLGFKPQHSLEEIIRSAYLWHKKQFS